MQTIADPRALLRWFDYTKRDLPWRRTSDAYAIWVSEVMLQQTQVATVIPYFEQWMKRFPTIDDLASAGEQDALSVWQGLGYYRRCRMLLSGARHIVARGMPKNAAEWLEVPGVGTYTAAAIASISLGERIAVVDGNVARVFARYEGCPDSGPSLKRNALGWATGRISSERPGDWNQALMELGATICRPRDPDCSSCPIRAGCVAAREGLQDVLPVPEKKEASISLHRAAWVSVRDGCFGLEPIPEGEWWQGMWRVPLFSESDGVRIGVVKHVVTKHKITMEVYLTSHPAKNLHWFSREELKHLPMPAPQRRALRMALDNLGGLFDL